MNKVPSAMALAFINAAVKNKQDLVKVDHKRWIPRAVAACADREVGMVSLSKHNAGFVSRGKNISRKGGHHAG